MVFYLVLENNIYLLVNFAKYILSFSFFEIFNK